MAFLRQCLLEARRRSGDLEGWIESMESTLGRDRTTADATLQQSAYPMSLAAAQASRSGPVPSARPQGG